MTDAQVHAKKRRTQVYLDMWKEVFSHPSEKLHLVFVSNSLFKEACVDVGSAPIAGRYSIIHNYIDGESFPYIEKPAEQRKNILSIRPFSGLKYANDLTAAAIVELSQKSFFNDLQFTIVGMGELFDEETAPLRGFKNVTLKNKFLNHEEISRLHQSHGIFLNPTRWDSQGVSRDEAMASGLVPVTTANSAIPEFVDEDCAILAPDGDHVGLAKAIEELFFDIGRFKSMSVAASKRVRQQSGFEQTIEREIALVTG